MLPSCFSLIVDKEVGEEVDKKAQIEIDKEVGEEVDKEAQKGGEGGG